MTHYPDLASLVAATNQVLESEALSPEERSELLEQMRRVESMTADERASHDYALRHIPQDGDPVLLVLKGQLLIEEQVRAFIAERLLTPGAIDDARLTSHQAICLAQSMTLPNDEPDHLWGVCKRINSLRNKVAHRLSVLDLKARMDEIESEYSKRVSVSSGFGGVIASVYGQLAELCRLARDPSFRVRGRR
tara:strand:- start:867 stop:1442 length:576 start_codon:yes stop_codon:yes gene_type:complete